MISFDSNNLESAYLIVNRLNRFNGAEREIQSETLSFQDGFEEVSAFWRNRTIVIGGTIDATSSAHLASLVDTLKQNLSGRNKNLDVDYGGSTRRFKGSLTRLEAPEEFYNITHLPYTAEFNCQPFGYATSTTTVDTEDVTASSHTDTITITGTYKPLPIITLTFDTASDVTSVSFENTSTGDTIIIEESISQDNVLIFNIDEQKVTLNGDQVDFSGPIPEFQTGDNSYQIDIGSTSHQYDLSISYLPRYL
jgi:hypothetical protein